MTTSATENVRLLKEFKIKRASDIEKIEPGTLRDKLVSAYVSGPGKRFWTGVEVDSKMNAESENRFKDK